MPRTAPRVTHSSSAKPPKKQKREEQVESLLPAPQSRTLKPLAFFEWMASFDEQQRSLATLSLYRDWPVIDKKLTDEACTRPTVIAWWGGDKPMPFDQPEEWEDFFLKNGEWGGSGDYKCICNETKVHGAIAICNFAWRNPEYPPVVDPAIVVKGDPKNKGYFDGLKARGIPIPGDEGDMNVATQVIDSLNKTNERLLDKMEERSDKLEERLVQIEEGDDEPDFEEVVEKSAAEKGFEVIASATTKAMDVLAAQNKQLAETKSPDTLEQLARYKAILAPESGGTMKVVELLLATQKDSLATVQKTQQESLATVMTMHKDTLAFMEKMEQKREQATAVVAPAGNPFQSTIETMRMIKEGAEMLGMSSRRREPVETVEAPPPQKPWYGAWLENPPMLFAGVALFQSLLTTVLNRGAAPAKPVTDVIRDAMDAGKKLMAETANGTGATPQATVTPEQQRMAFLSFIEPVFIAHYFDAENRGLTGFTFAEVFLTLTQNPTTGQVQFVPDGRPAEFGMSQYQAVKSGGLDAFDKMIRSYPPIWNLVQGNLSKYNQFLTQFFTYQEEAQKQTAVN